LTGALPEINIVGKNHIEVKLWLIKKLPSIVKLDIPEDWESPVSQLLDENNLCVSSLGKSHP
jgi:hypothetical protein